MGISLVALVFSVILCIAIMRISRSTYMFICIHVNDAYDDAADAPSQCDVASIHAARGAHATIWHMPARAARGVHATSGASADGV